MNNNARFTHIWLIVFTILFSQSARALDTGDVLRALAIGYGVKSTAKPVNDFINTVTANHNLPVGATTKVVPVLTVGEKGYVGAAQIAGTAAQVGQVEAIYRYSAAFQSNKYRIMLMFPNHDINPLNFKRVQGVGITALVDISISGAAPALTSGGVDANDIVRAAAIGAAITQVADPLNDFINDLYKQEKIAATYASKVVPGISVGERAYIGGMQVTGPAAAVARVKAVFVYDELFDSGRYRINLVVPGDTINPLKFQRVKGVGVSAVIETTVATSIETAGKGREAGDAAARSSARSVGDAALADDWIARAHQYIEDTKKFVDQNKKSEEKGKGKKSKNRGHNASAANKRLAEARKVLAEARHARAKKDYSRSAELAQKSMRIADEARVLIQ